MQAKSHQKEPYVQLFLRLSHLVEKVLLRIIITLIALLIGMQGLLQIHAVRLWVTEVDQLEGVPYGYTSELNVK